MCRPDFFHSLRRKCPAGATQQNARLSELP
jgi:hypothetical protein